MPRAYIETIFSSKPGKIAAEIDRFNAINREETARAGARYVDVTPVSRRAATERSLIAGDGLHPSGPMYAEWARLALPAAVHHVLTGGALHDARGLLCLHVFLQRLAPLV